MHPVFLHIPLFGGFNIYSYGVMVALGFALGILWTTREAKRVGVSQDLVVDLAFYLIVAAIVGSRILFIIVEWRDYVADPLKILRIWEGGLVFYGGLLGALLIGYWYVRKYKLSYFSLGDLFLPAVALGHSIGRLGCFLAGCCYGKFCTIPWIAVSFPNKPFTIAPADLPLYPTQLIESAMEFLLFLGLVWISRRKKFEGQVLLLYVIGYAITRSVIEILRGDQARGFVIPEILSTSQTISALLILLAICVYFYRRGKISKGEIHS